MNLHELSPAPGSNRDRFRVGRGTGSGNGKTSGKGHKGAKARSGYSRKRAFEGGQMPLARRVPKRGFNNIFAVEVESVNVSLLEKLFEGGAEVNPVTLKAAGLVKGTNVKILGGGELSKKFNVSGCALSEGAAAKIKSAGGTVKED